CDLAHEIRLPRLAGLGEDLLQIALCRAPGDARAGSIVRQKYASCEFAEQPALCRGQRIKRGKVLLADPRMARRIVEQNDSRGLRRRKGFVRKRGHEGGNGALAAATW